MHALSNEDRGSVIVVGHGATHDFVPGALCPEEHPTSRHTPYCPPHCSFTTLEEYDGGWHVLQAGVTPWRDQDRNWETFHSTVTQKMNFRRGLAKVGGKGSGQGSPNPMGGIPVKPLA